MTNKKGTGRDNYETAIMQRQTGKTQQRKYPHYFPDGMAVHCGIFFRGFCRPGRFPDGQLPGILCSSRGRTHNPAEIYRTGAFLRLKCGYISAGCQKAGRKQGRGSKPDSQHRPPLYPCCRNHPQLPFCSTGQSHHSYVRLHPGNPRQRCCLFQNHHGRHDL